MQLVIISLISFCTFAKQFFNNASSANPIVGAKEILNSHGLSDVVINGINDIEAGRNRD